MTIYSVKINKHEIVKTTALHEAINLAKQTLTSKIASKGLYPVSVNEKMYVHNNKATYRIFITVQEPNWKGVYRNITYSNSVQMEHICNGGYNFNLHREMTDAIEATKKNKGAV